MPMKMRKMSMPLNAAGTSAGSSSYAAADDGQNRMIGSSLERMRRQSDMNFGYIPGQTSFVGDEDELPTQEMDSVIVVATTDQTRLQALVGLLDENQQKVAKDTWNVDATALTAILVVPSHKVDKFREHPAATSVTVKVENLQKQLAEHYVVDTDNNVLAEEAQNAVDESDEMTCANANTFISSLRL